MTVPSTGTGRHSRHALLSGIAIGAALSTICTALTGRGYSLTLMLPLTITQTASWAILIVVADRALRGRSVATARTRTRIALSLTMLVAAYGAVSVQSVFTYCGITFGTAHHWSAWNQLLLVLGEQGGAALALLLIVSAHFTAGPSPLTIGEAATSVTVGIWLRIAIWWLVAELLSAVIARWFLESTHVLPMAAGDFHSHPATLPATLEALARSILAGPYEELGYTALLAIILYRAGTDRQITLTRRTVPMILLVAGLLRAIPHLYYGQGELTAPTILPIPDNLASAAQQVVWCALWAGGAMLVFLHYQRIWPIAVAHSVWDLALFNGWTLFSSFCSLILIWQLIKQIRKRWPNSPTAIAVNSLAAAADERSERYAAAFRRHVLRRKPADADH